MCCPLTCFILFSDATCDIPTNNCKFNQIWITCNQQFPCPMGFYCHDNICIDSCKDGRCLRFKDVCTRYIKHFYVYEIISVFSTCDFQSDFDHKTI